MRVYGYTRVSHNPKEMKVSPESQKSEIEEKSKNLGLGKVTVIHDNKSGKTLDRPGIQELMTLVENNQVDVLLVWKVNRLSRNMLDLLNIQELCKSGKTRLISISENYDSSSSSAQETYKLQVLASVSQLQRTIVSENIQSSLRLKHAKGLPLSGNAPYGYRYSKKGLLINKQESTIVKLIFDLYWQGCGYKKIAKELGTRHIMRCKGHYFSVDDIKRILKNETYTGYFNNEFGRVLGVHEAIVSLADYQKVQQLKQTKHGVKTNEKFDFLFRKKVICGYCKSSLTTNVVTSKKRQYRYYQCSRYVASGACQSFTINADKLEMTVVEKVKEFLLESDIWQMIQSEVQLLVKEEKQDMQKTTILLDQQQQRLFLSFQQGAITQSCFQEKLKEIVNKRTGLKEHNYFKTVIGGVEGIVRSIDSLEEEMWSRGFIETLVDKINLSASKEITGIYLKNLEVNILERREFNDKD